VIGPSRRAGCRNHRPRGDPRHRWRSAASTPSPPPRPSCRARPGPGGAGRRGDRRPRVRAVPPTAIDIGRDPAPLATEALRGEGAVLVDGAGERFMTRYHPAAELAPRDVVARAIHAERAPAAAPSSTPARRWARTSRRRSRPCSPPASAAASIRASSRSRWRRPATTTWAASPRTRGRTSLAGLYAAGECASTGVHGANRLASNSLLEAAVFGPAPAAPPPGGAGAARPGPPRRADCRAALAGPAPGHEPRRRRGARRRGPGRAPGHDRRLRGRARAQRPAGRRAPGRDRRPAPPREPRRPLPRRLPGPWPRSAPSSPARTSLSRA
jgi:hypothetical protein